MEQKLQKSKVEDWLDNPKRVLVGGLVIGIGGFLLYKFGRKFVTNLRKKNVDLQADKNLEVQQAMLLRNAMNPSGISWMMWMDGTNNDMIYSTAKKITDYDKVAIAYRKLYDSGLVADLQSELTTEEYQKFLTLISMNAKSTTSNTTTTTSNSSTTTNTTGVFAKKGQMFVAKKEVTLRSSPDASYHGAIYESSSGNNILMTAKAGDFIGYATGKQEFDVTNNVKFIQAGFIVKKDGVPDLFKAYAGKKYTFWVSSSTDYVDKFDYYKPMFDKYSGTAAIVAFKKPLDFYDTEVKGFPHRLVVSVNDLQVLDDKMQPYVDVEKQTLLGEYIGELNTSKKSYVKFRTVDNTERWAEADNIKIIER
jgi:hypothetical protein